MSAKVIETGLLPFVLLNNPTWEYQHIERDGHHTLCGIDTRVGAWPGALPSRKVIGTKPICPLCVANFPWPT